MPDPRPARAAGPALVSTRLFRMPDDLEIVPAIALDDPTLTPGDALAARRGSRQPPRLLSADTLALLETFRTPRSLVDAIVEHARITGADPVTVLDESFGVLVALSQDGLLVPADTAADATLTSRLQAGERVGPAVVDRLVRLLRDTEIWQGHLADEPGRPVAVKLIDDPVLGETLCAAEALALQELRGRSAPRLHAALPRAHGGVLVSAWKDGVPADLVARDPGGRRLLARQVLAAYADLHAARVLHGDVHAGNVVVAPDGTVTLIDFGLASVAGGPRPPRPNGGEQLEPEAAATLLADPDAALPALTFAAEQYAVAVLVYRILTGEPMLDLETERAEALRRIRDVPPARFVSVGAPAWPAAERVLRRAMAKDPARRFRDLGTMLAAFDRALQRPAADASTPRMTEPLRTAVASFDVGGRWWPGAAATGGSPTEIAQFLHRVAVLTGDADSAALAAVWVARADGTGPHAPGPRHPVARMHRSLARYRRTGRAAALVAAHRARGELAALPDPGRPSVTSGELAVLLAELECADPWQARPPWPAAGQK